MFPAHSNRSTKQFASRCTRRRPQPRRTQKGSAALLLSGMLADQLTEHDLCEVFRAQPVKLCNLRVEIIFHLDHTTPLQPIAPLKSAPILCQGNCTPRAGNLLPTCR